MIEEAQRCVSSPSWEDVKSEFERAKVGIISIDGKEVKRVKAM